MVFHSFPGARRAPVSCRGRRRYRDLCALILLKAPVPRPAVNSLIRRGSGPRGKGVGHMRKFLAVLAILFALPVQVQAQQLLESYTALLSWNDHYNSNGQRLTEPWQVVRQDRANFHRFGTGDPQDQWDSFFGDFNNRAAMEQMLLNGYISPQARNAIVNGEAFVYVEIWGTGTTGTSVRVDVAGGGTMQGQGTPPPPPPGGGGQQLLESYTAFLSWNDHQNSNGQRLTEPWQIIRQDRANFHRYGTGDPQDGWDSYFGDFNNRAAMEQMLLNGYISPQARSAIVNSQVMIRVELWGQGGRVSSIRVDVF
jgi:hypothetical protein